VSMSRVGSLVALVLGLGMAFCAADSIIIDKKIYKGVEVVESGSRYYIKAEKDGLTRTVSVSKDDVKADEICFGDGPTPWELAAANRGEPVTAGASRIELLPETLDGTPPFEADALVICVGETAVGFCAVDTAALDHTLLDAVAKLLEDAGSAIGRDNLMLSATHTQSGTCPGVMQGPVQEAAFGTFKEQRVGAVAALLAQAIQEAEGKLEPAQLRVAAVQAPRYNRNRNDDEGVKDAALGVLCVETAEGSPLAYLINYAAHPAIMAEETLAVLRKEPVYARDFPGGIAEGLREDAPDIPVVFINGAGGDLAPNPPLADTPAEAARAMGLALAKAALDALGGVMPQPSAEIAVRSRDVALPPTVLADLLPETVVLTDVRVNDTLFLSLPGEVCSALGLMLRDRAQSQEGVEHVFLCGLTNDYCGYHTGPEDFFGDNLEAQLSFFGPLVARWYMESYGFAAVDAPWAYCPMVAGAKTEYLEGIDKGKTEAETIAAAWDKLLYKLATLAPMMNAVKEIPAEAKALMGTVPAGQLVNLAVQGLSVYGRMQYAEWPAAKWVTLMGVADGAGVPFDAVFVLQFIATPAGLPEEATKVLPALEIEGIDFLGGGGPDETPGTPGQNVTPAE